MRTFNTLLRGCLWTAATENEEGVVAGGVVSSEAAWALFQRTCRQRLQDECKVDLSSYEYSVTLLCQALRAKEAEDRVEDFKRTFRVSETVESGAMESLAVCYQSLARMYVLLQDKEEVKRAVKSGLKAVDEAFQHVSKAGNDAKPDGEGNAKRVLEGGTFCFVQFIRDLWYCSCIFCLKFCGKSFGQLLPLFLVPCMIIRQASMAAQRGGH